jgi:ribosome-associated toxin RatA of RatAB toxin-antitoxin module
MSWFGFGEEKKVGETQGCKEHITINAPMSECLTVIYDYNRYAEFLTDISEVKIAKKISEEVQDVYWNISLMVTSLEYTLRLTKTKNGVTWVSTDHGPFTHNNGGWVLTEKDGHTYAEYTVDCAFNVITKYFDVFRYGFRNS